MRLGLMQPYLFPYIGYFQLIDACDQFVIFDDAQYIKGGWVNRNRMLIGGTPEYLTVPLKADSNYKAINERQLADGCERELAKAVRRLEGAYRKAPHFGSAMALVEKCFVCDDRNLATFLTHSIRCCCEALGIETPITLSSAMEKSPDLVFSDRVIDIVQRAGADQYLNAIGGKELYDKAYFAEKGIELQFLQPREFEYSQFGKPFVPWLSIIDVLMFNSRTETRELLGEFELV